MKRFLCGLALFVFAGLASAQTIPVWVLWSSSWVRWDGGPIAPGGVTPYCGTPALGDIIYYNGSCWTSLIKPADGTYSVTFTAGVPSWAAGGGGGLGDPGANGVVVRTALNTTTARTLVCANTACSYSNGNGVSGAPTLTIAANTTDPGGAIVAQATTPGTQQGTGGNTNINTNGTWIEELDNLAAVGTDGVIAQNTTAAVVGTQNQVSPSFKMCGTGWNTVGTVSETDCWRAQAFQTGGNPTVSSYRLLSSINGGAYTAPFTLTNGGGLTIAGQMAVASGVTSSSATNTFGITGSVAGAGGLTWAYQNSGAMLLTGNRLVSAACTSGTTCDSGTNIPANAVVLSVAYRITTAVTGATTIELGTATNATAFCTGLTTLTVNTTGVCSGGPTVGAGVNGAAVALRATATVGTFTAGVIEYEISYIVATPPTS